MSRFTCRFVFVSMAGAIAIGCGSPSSNHNAKRAGKQTGPPDPDLTMPTKLNAAGATYSMYGPMPNHELYYKIHTVGVSADFLQNQLDRGFGGHVTGTMVKRDNTTFSADGAHASKSSPSIKDLDVLTLQGNVAIHSKQPVGDLYCDKLVINFKTHVIKASGNVRFNTASGMTGTLPEAWATQDLSKIASPTLFQENMNQ